MYYADLTGWHYLSFLTQAFHLLALHGIDLIEKKIPQFKQYFTQGTNWIRQKFGKGTPNEGGGGKKSNQKTRKPRGNSVLPNGIEDFETPVLRRDSETLMPPLESMQLAQKSVGKGGSSKVPVVKHGHQKPEDSSPSISGNRRKASSISVTTYPSPEDGVLGGASEDDNETHAKVSTAGSSKSLEIHLLKSEPELQMVPLSFITDDFAHNYDLPPQVQDDNEPALPGSFSDDEMPQNEFPQNLHVLHGNNSEEEEALPHTGPHNYSDDATEIIDSSPDDLFPYHQGGHGIHLLSLDEHLPLDFPFCRDPVEVTLWNDQTPSYVPLIRQVSKTSDTSEEENLIGQVLNAELPRINYSNSTSQLIDSLPPIEETAKFEPDYAEMYHFNKHGVHSLSPDKHLPLDIPFIRAPIEEAIAHGITPSYIPLDTSRRGSRVSIPVSDKVDDMVDEVLEAIVPAPGQHPEDVWVEQLPTAHGLPEYNVNMDKLYSFHDEVHLLSPDPHLPLDLPFLREPVEASVARHQTPSYVPLEIELHENHPEEAEELAKEVIAVNIGSGVEVNPVAHHKDWMPGVPEILQHPEGDVTPTYVSGYSVHFPSDEHHQTLIHQHDLPKSELAAPHFSHQHSIISTQTSASIYVTPPETPIHNPTTIQFTSHARHESTGSDTSRNSSQFPWFKSKTLRDRKLVGPENVVHSDDTSHDEA